jgi:hypothetical protein
MVLTRWTSNTNTLVTPVNANVWIGKFQIPVISGTSDFNVHAGIDADLGGIFALRPQTTIASISWQVVLQLVSSNLSSISAFGGNPPRYKFGSATFAQGLYAMTYEAINYQLCLLPRQQFLFAEGFPESSLGALVLPPVPEAFDFIFAPSSPSFGGFGGSIDAYGASRVQFLFNAGILGIADIAYTAVDISGTFVPSTSSVVISQL